MAVRRHHPDPDRRPVGDRRDAGRGHPPSGRADVHRRLRPDRPGRRRWSRRVSSGTPTPISFGVVRADNFALFINIILCIVGIMTMVFSHDVVEREGLPAGEYYALTLFAISGMMLMAAATDLLVIFLALEVLSLAVYVLTGLRRSSVGRAPKRRSSISCSARSRARSSSTASRSPSRIAGSTRLDASATAIALRRRTTHAGAARGRAARRRLLLQGLRGAVPHVDAGRLRRGADDCHRVHVHGREGGGVCRVRARVPVGVRADAARTGCPCSATIAGATMVLGAVLGVLAEQRQAHARVFQHRARRLPARSASSRPTPPARAPSSSTC